MAYGGPAIGVAATQKQQKVPIVLRARPRCPGLTQHVMLSWYQEGNVFKVVVAALGGNVTCIVLHSPDAMSGTDILCAAARLRGWRKHRSW
eukprot:35166-Rhodomonas_salina.4